jgi:hypothetical protein
LERVRRDEMLCVHRFARKGAVLLFTIVANTNAFCTYSKCLIAHMQIKIATLRFVISSSTTSTVAICSTL